MSRFAIKFLIAHRRRLTMLGFVLFLVAAVLPLTGCGVPVWLSDAGSIIAMVGASFASVSSFIAGLTGNVALAAALAVVASWITKVQTGVEDLQSLIAQYQAAPNTGLLGAIEAALADLQANVKQDFSNLGLPVGVLTVISGIAGLADNLLTEWASAIAGVKNAATSAEFRLATAHILLMADNLPKAMESYKASVNKLLSTSTGDAEIDAALEKATRL